MSAAVQLDANRVWTVADLASLPDELCRRSEIVDGLLIVSPQPAALHIVVSDRLRALLTRFAPGHLHVSNGFGVEIAGTYRVPDLAVVRRSVFDSETGTLSPGDVVLAVEVESPSSITTDRITKPVEYATGGIRHYWRVEMAPLRLLTYRLAGDAYEATGSWAADEVATITEPFAAEIDLRMLLPD